MLKSLTGIAAAAMLTIIAAPGPAAAAPIQNAPGISEGQASVEFVQHRRWHRRHWRGHRHGWHGPRFYGPRPYVYADPYPRRYYRRHYAPAPHIQVGPLGFGFW